MIFGMFSLSGKDSGPLISAVSRNLRKRCPSECLIISDRTKLLASDGSFSSIFRDPETGMTACFSGEIYNERELAGELSAAGMALHEGNNAEIFLRGRVLWGADLLKKLNGEWSAVVFDPGSASLFCSRDRIGIEKFYYSLDKDFFAFSSDFHAMFLIPKLSAELNRDAAFDYIALNRVEHPRQTLISGVEKLESGSAAVLRIRPGSEFRQKKYYAPDLNRELGGFSPKKCDAYCGEFSSIFSSSVKMRMRGRYACQLSGGLDSTSVTAVADRLSGKKGGVEALSLLWETEREFIKSAAARLSFRTNFIMPSETESIGWDDAVRVLLDYEYPQKSPNFLGTALMMKRVNAKGINVLLDGNGGDELLVGYPNRYFTVYLNQLLACGRPERFKKEFRKLYSDRLEEFGIRGGRIPSAFLGIFTKNHSIKPALCDFLIDKTLDRDFLDGHSARMREYYRSSPDTNLQDVLYRDTLELGEKHNVYSKVRYSFPFLDHRLVEFAFALPLRYKLHDGWTKYLLRRSMDRLLPPEVCWRREKVGGTVPRSKWLVFLAKNSGHIRELLGRRRLRIADIVNRKGLASNFDALIKTAASPLTSDMSGLFRLVNLELWYDNIARIRASGS